MFVFVCSIILVICVVNNTFSPYEHNPRTIHPLKNDLENTGLRGQASRHTYSTKYHNISHGYVNIAVKTIQHIIAII
jgi:hypothetical protein